MLQRDPQAVLRGAAAGRGRAQTTTSVWRLRRSTWRASPELEYEDLSGLFARSMLNHAVIGMTTRRAAYVFGVTRPSRATKAIGIGRWRGGPSASFTPRAIFDCQAV